MTKWATPLYFNGTRYDDVGTTQFPPSAVYYFSSITTCRRYEYLRGKYIYMHVLLEYLHTRLVRIVTRAVSILSILFYFSQAQIQGWPYNANWLTNAAWKFTRMQVNYEKFFRTRPNVIAMMKLWITKNKRDNSLSCVLNISHNLSIGKNVISRLFTFIFL